MGIRSRSSQEEGPEEPNKSLVEESFVSIRELLYVNYYTYNYFLALSAEKAYKQGHLSSNEHTQLPDTGC